MHVFLLFIFRQNKEEKQKENILVLVIFVLYLKKKTFFEVRYVLVTIFLNYIQSLHSNKCLTKN